MEEGWTFGHTRDDNTLKHPDLIPYHLLNDGEKSYDRNTALNALKLIVKMGFRIVKDAH